MHLIAKLKNYLGEQKLQSQSEDYVILLENFDFEDEKNTNQIFGELKNTAVSLIASNGGSKEWSFLISWRQRDNLDHSKNIIETMSPVLAKFGLKIEKIWLR